MGVAPQARFAVTQQQISAELRAFCRWTAIYIVFDSQWSSGLLYITRRRFCKYINPRHRKNVSTSRVVTKLQGKRINRAKRYDNTSMILFGDDGKLYWFDVSGMNVIAQNEAGFPFACDVDDITSVLKDSHGNIWIGTKLNGYKVIYNKEKRFQTNNDVAQYFQGKTSHTLRGVCKVTTML